MREKDWWKQAIEDSGMRSVFHALCEYKGEDVWSEILEYVIERPWVAELKGRFQTVSRVADAVPWERGDEELLQTLYLLYAASRVRDVLIFARQPAPVDPVMQRGLDEWLGRTEPSFELVSIPQFERFFAAIGCRSETVDSFDPVFHEIVVCEPTDEPSAEIVVVEHLWPTLMIGQLVFTRAGVRVRADSAYARPGVADRSPLYAEYWRRHRRTHDLSMGWGTNSQWGTCFRRDYAADEGNVFNFDAGADPRDGSTGRSHVDGLSPGEQVELVKNRCLLTSDKADEFWPHDWRVDERD